MAKLQGGPVSVIVTLCEPTVIAPVRVGELLFEATVKPALPSPVPCCPKSMTIQLTVEAAVLTQVLELATIFTTPAPPAIGKDEGEAVRVKVQFCAPRTPAKTRKQKTRRSEGTRGAKRFTPRARLRFSS